MESSAAPLIARRRRNGPWWCACFPCCWSSWFTLPASFDDSRANAEAGAEPQTMDAACTEAATAEAHVWDGARPTPDALPVPCESAPPLAPLSWAPDAQANSAWHKYWRKRHELWSRYDEGIRMDQVGWFSVTPEATAALIAQRCRCDVVLDAFAGVGGNSIQFANAGCRVIAIELDSDRLSLARHNAGIYGVAERIEWVHGNCTALWSTMRADVVFLSPPWGGISYMQAGVNLRALGGFDCHELIRGALAISDRVVLYLPRTVDEEQLTQLGVCHAAERAARRVRAAGARDCADAATAAVSAEACMEVDIQTEECEDKKGTVRALAVYLGFGAPSSQLAALPDQLAPRALAPGVRPCAYFFRTGRCAYGATCRYSHDEAHRESGGAAAQPSDASAAFEREWADAVEASPAPGVRPCAYFFRTGRCAYGATCRYSHDEAHRESGGAATQPSDASAAFEREWADAVEACVRVSASGRLPLSELGIQLRRMGFAPAKQKGSLKSRLRVQHAARFAVEGADGAESIRFA